MYEVRNHSRHFCLLWWKETMSEEEFCTNTRDKDGVRWCIKVEIIPTRRHDRIPPWKSFISLLLFAQAIYEAPQIDFYWSLYFMRVGNSYSILYFTCIYAILQYVWVSEHLVHVRRNGEGGESAQAFHIQKERRLQENKCREQSAI